MQRAVPRRHHLRRHQGKQANRRDRRAPGASGGQSRGLRQQLLAQRHAAHDGDAEQRRQPSEQRGDGKVTSEDVADRADADAERRLREAMGDKIARHRGDADRRQAGRGISADHQFESVERAGERCPECPGDRGGGAASDHDALIGAAQMKSAAERGGKAAGELGISRFQSDRSADARGPDRLQRDDHAATK